MYIMTYLIKFTWSAFPVPYLAIFVDVVPGELLVWLRNNTKCRGHDTVHLAQEHLLLGAQRGNGVSFRNTSVAKTSSRSTQDKSMLSQLFLDKRIQRAR